MRNRTDAPTRVDHPGDTETPRPHPDLPPLPRRIPGGSL